MIEARLCLNVIIKNIAVKPKITLIKVNKSANLIKFLILNSSMSVLLTNLNSDLKIHSIAEIIVNKIAIQIKTQSTVLRIAGMRAIV